MASYEGRPIPKFGDWDVNNPASADEFTVIFNKARNDRRILAAGGRVPMPKSRPVDNTYDNTCLQHEHETPKRRWFCCG